MFRTRTGARRLSLLLMTALLLGALPAALVGTAAPAAHAAIAPRVAATLTANPDAAPAGATITLTGANYNATTTTVTPTVSVAFTDARGVRTTLPQTATVNTSGAFTLQVVVPATAPAGSASFVAADSSGAVATTAFDVRPAAGATKIAAAPSTSLPGTTTTITGTGFAINQPITVTFTQGALVTDLTPSSLTTSDTGLFTATVTVPGNAQIGAAALTARDRDNNSATVAFTVGGAARIGATPNTSLPGATTTITGTGFAINEPVTVTFTQGALVTDVSTNTITTTNTGLFTATVTVPGNAPAGTAALTARDRDNNSATTSFTVTRTGVPTVVVSPTNTTPGSTVAVTGTGFAVSQPLTLTFGQGANVTNLISGTVSTDAAGVFTTTTVIPSTAITGTAAITATDRSGNTGAGAFNVAFPFNANNGPTTLYFAEGYTGLLTTNHKATFDETLSILNANPFTATVQIQYLIEGGSPVVVTRSIAPTSTLRESVNTDVGSDKNVAAVVSSASRVTAERIIRRTGAAGVLDANSSLGNPNLGKTFYFAEGYTGASFQEYLTLANPGNTTANVTVNFAPQGATGSVTQTLTLQIPPQGRVTRNIRRDTLGIPNKSLGLVVTSDQSIMAERVLYFGDGDGSAKYGSTAKAGIQTVGNQYIFAYGSAGGAGLAQRPGDQSFVTVLNPGTSPVSSTIVAQFFDALGRNIGSTSLAVAPGTRETLNANQAVSNTASIYATVLTSASPFVAEKPQYFGGSPNTGAHPGVAPTGAPAGVKSAAFPDLNLVDAAGQAEQQTVFLYNPTSAPIAVTGTYYSGNGSKSQVYSVPAGNIVTVNVNTDAAGLPAGALGATFTVTSTGANDSFVATNIANTTDGRSYTGNQGALPAQ